MKILIKVSYFRTMITVKMQEWKLSNEWQVFNLTPFKHTIKLEADMLFTTNTDWWWNHFGIYIIWYFQLPL